MLRSPRRREIHFQEIRMAQGAPVPITVCCMMKLTSSNLSYEPSELIMQLRERLEKRLTKKGFTVQWVPATQNPTLLVQLTRLDEGSQALRYLLPFISPAVMDVEGRININGAQAHPFQYTQRAQFGLFGGTARSMMNNNADRLAVKIVKDVLRVTRGP
jgi:hypothetical protein